MDGSGNLFVGGVTENALMKVSASGVISNISLPLNLDVDPNTLAFDAAGNLFIGDYVYAGVYKIAAGS